ncbi:hypothetical protein CH11_gp07 [Acinetobacter phage IMEAB3]|uniref:Uncharacterized protein n=2 Tax=Lokivirus IMEAB3 TaxID=2560266 RepID=A0A481S290_9CAUD|nr:hypothetical protein CH11_gp07 [Acinetobacter phage IMEAB3]AHI60006.1 hypothetical protein IME_AB3_07 [Acinetobacter phage IMEAB3]QBG78721.1 hypothetical protein vBAbaSD0_27 [Acinetobacter phage vB_AbaS_D0]HCH8674060.1 hypothetical protein [Salmonella enterica]
MVEKIELFKTSDGELFEQENDAVNHQLILDLVEAFGEVRWIETVDPKDMKAFLLENKTEILKLYGMVAPVWGIKG